jgi:hypothetical protein
VQLAVQQPGLGLMQLLLGSHALTTAAAIVSTSYWATPQVRTHSFWLSLFSFWKICAVVHLINYVLVQLL